MQCCKQLAHVSKRPLQNKAQIGRTSCKPVMPCSCYHKPLHPLNSCSMTSWHSKYSMRSKPSMHSMSERPLKQKMAL